MTLRRTDWWLIPHAAKMMVERGIPRDSVLDTAENPEQTYVAGGKHNCTDRMVYQRGDIALIVNTRTKEIITVLFRSESW